MPAIPRQAQTEGSPSFNPDDLFESWARGDIGPPQNSDFRGFILRSFNIDSADEYGYQATIEVTLAQAQKYVDYGGQGGLHNWYVDADGNQLLLPPAAPDISAYTDIFRPTTNTSSAIKQLGANAKKGSIRADIAKHITANHQPFPAVIPKSKTHVNPYFDLWAWTCQNLEWAGPTDDTVKIHHSHPILPIIFHHFGCVCPSYEALEVIRQAAKGRTIVDIGSGNGYWDYMLRRVKDGKTTLHVDAVDNGISEWRTVWIPDTIEMDGVKFLQTHDNGRKHVLLMVYPSVSNAFTAKTIAAYKGTTIIIAGTQNANGFTAFRELLVDWFAREMPQWEKRAQIPLPSFAGKDEALFVFEKQ